MPAWSEAHRFTPRPVIARSVDDIMAARGVKPVLSPNLETLAALEACGAKRALFIGVGCQVRAVCPGTHSRSGASLGASYSISNVMQHAQTTTLDTHRSVNISWWCTCSQVAQWSATGCSACGPWPVLHLVAFLTTLWLDMLASSTTAANLHMLQVQALRSVEKYLGMERLYILGTNW